MLQVKLPKPPKEPKTPSQRLRATLWCLWEERTGNLEPDKFDEWYEIQIEKVIIAVKSKLKR